MFRIMLSALYKHINILLVNVSKKTLLYQYLYLHVHWYPFNW